MADLIGIIIHLHNPFRSFRCEPTSLPPAPAPSPLHRIGPIYPRPFSPLHTASVVQSDSNSTAAASHSSARRRAGEVWGKRPRPSSLFLVFFGPGGGRSCPAAPAHSQCEDGVHMGCGLGFNTRGAWRDFMADHRTAHEVTGTGKCVTVPAADALEPSPPRCARPPPRTRTTRPAQHTRTHTRRRLFSLRRRILALPGHGASTTVTTIAILSARSGGRCRGVCRFAGWLSGQGTKFPCPFYS